MRASSRLPFMMPVPSPPTPKPQIAPGVARLSPRYRACPAIHLVAIHIEGSGAGIVDQGKVVPMAGIHARHPE